MTLLLALAVAGTLDALVLDLRGRGGSATEIPRILQVIDDYRTRTTRPVVALADRQSRSTKFPTGRLPKYTDLLEQKPVEPDVPVERPGLYAAGRDVILEVGVAEARRLAVAGRGTSFEPVAGSVK